MTELLLDIRSGGITTRNMRLTLALILVLTVSAGCATKPDTATDWAMAAESAVTPEAHASLANHFEELAQTAEATADEQRRMLAH